RRGRVRPQRSTLGRRWFASRGAALSRSRSRDARGRGRVPEGPRLGPGEHGVPGERAVIELLRASPGRVRRLLIEQGRDFPAVFELAEAASLRIERVEREVHDSLVGPGLARGVLAVTTPP